MSQGFFTSGFPIRIQSILRSIVLIVVSATAVAAHPSPDGSEHPEWKQYFDAFHVHGSFVLYDLNRDRFDFYNRPRCDSGFIPASTFKIVNSMIALESGVIPDEHTVFRWDGVKRDVPAWNHDQDMAAAFTNSTVWYYQEIARKVGRKRMQHYLDTLGYGNRDISGPIDSFWLNGRLRITPLEQIALLRRLYFDSLPFSHRSMRIVKEIFPREIVGSDTLYRKTGLGDQPNLTIGWMVGFVRKAGRVYFFAANFESASPDKQFANARGAITKKILNRLGILEESR